MNSCMNPPRREENGSKKMYRVFCLDGQTECWYLSRTAYEAMESHLYCLNLKHYDKDAKVLLMGGGRTFGVEHNGVTWSCLNDR